MTTIERTKSGRPTRTGKRAADRDRNKPTPERQRHGAFKHDRVKGPDGLAAMVWMPADLPRALSAAMTDRHKAWVVALQEAWTDAERCPGVSRDPDAIGGGNEADGPQATVTAERYARAHRRLARYERRIRDAGCHPVAWLLLKAVLHEHRPWRDLIDGLDLREDYAVHVAVGALDALAENA